MEKVKVVVVKPNEKPYVASIEEKLESYQKIVGGLIDVVSLDDEIDIVINDEGLLLQMKPNIMHPHSDECLLVGNCVFVGHDGEGNFISLTREQISRVFEKVDELRFKLLKYSYNLLKRKYEDVGNEGK